MSTSFNLVDFDDGPTLVMAHPSIHTEVMDRRRLPPISGVMPIAQPIAQPVATPSADSTQPALRVRRDLAGTRRLAVGLAIALAFVLGLAGAFIAQYAGAGASPTVVAINTRAPREVTDRSSTLDTRSTPAVLPHAEKPAPVPATKRATVPPPPPDAPESPSIEGHDLLGEGLGTMP